MNNVEIETTGRINEFHFFPEIFSQLLSTMTTSDLTKYLSKKRAKQRLRTDISLSKLFFLLEREQPINAISNQVHLSETIELIRGTIVSDDIKQYRGLLLNIERAMIYFYLFYWIFRFFKEHKTAETSFNCYSSFQHIFESLWQVRFPHGLIRPESIVRPFDLSRIPEIQKIIFFQQKNAWLIAKCIERKLKINNTLMELEILSLDNVKTSGITGPIARASGSIPSLISSASVPTRQSAQLFLKYAYAKDNNLLNVLRVGYVELILALNRISQLLIDFPSKILDTSTKPLNGEATSVFSTVLGESHLTVNTSDNQVKYFNFIPPQMSNITGFLKILSTCPISIKPILLLFFDPEIAFNLE
ncbi:MAG: hypothetical protein JSU57_02625 [Candidatus Heimdallarchaeota archaeon]|nr:MAG: hypothetical protein JSU57_02625 [Candidatus Heimdallarchaeota archaeon]